MPRPHNGSSPQAWSGRNPVKVPAMLTPGLASSNRVAYSDLTDNDRRIEMAKAHTELKDRQKDYAKQARRRNVFGNFTRPDGSPMTGVDITYLGSFRGGKRRAA